MDRDEGEVHESDQRPDFPTIDHQRDDVPLHLSLNCPRIFTLEGRHCRHECYGVDESTKRLIKKELPRGIGFV